MKRLLENRLIIIVLATFAIVGLTVVSFNASQTQSPTSNPSSSTQSPTSLRTATMKPVTDHPIRGQLIVKFKPQYTDAQINANLEQYHAVVIKDIPDLDQKVVRVPVIQEAIISNQLKNDPYVETIQQDYTTHAFLTPNDPLFTSEYDLNNTGQSIEGQRGTPNDDIHAETAWNTTEGNGVKVAILDTGINLNQPDLAGKVVVQKSFVTGVSSVEDGNGHGTHVAGILAADTNNGIGIAGTCPGCQLIIGKVLDDSGEGTTSDAANGITWAADNGAKVISMSLGTTDAGSASLYNQAVSYALSKGAVVIAASGNDGTSQLNYPAAATGVISVAATTNNDKKASYSNYGSWVQIAAPGNNILSTGPTHSFQIEPFGYSTSNPYYYLSGTSMATPVVSGVAALIASTSYGTTPQALTNRLYSTADKISGTGTYWKNGRVDAAAAVGTITAAVATPTISGAITPTLYCVGGAGVPPCATIAPTNSNSAPVPTGSGTGTNPSTSPSPSEVAISGPAVSGGLNPSTSPSGTPSNGSIPGLTLPCPNQSASVTSSSNKKVTIYARGRRGSKWRPRSNGFIGRFFQFLLQWLLQLLQQIGINPCGGSGTPTTTPAPSQPASSPSPSQSVSTVPPASGSPSTGITQPTTSPTSGNAPTIAPAPTAGGTTDSCVTSATNGRCPSSGYYTDAQIVGGTDPWVNQNIWGAGGTNYQQTLHANGAGDWYITASVNNPSGSVLTYPNTGWTIPAKTVDSFSTITSSWNVTIPTDNTITGGWAAYDLWFNNWADEVMIQVDIVANSNYNCSSAASATFNGQPWHLCVFGSERVWKPGTDDNNLRNETSGSIDVKAMLEWMEQNGYLPKSSVWTAPSFGFEVTNTSGTTQTFKVNGLTWTAQ